MKVATNPNVLFVAHKTGVSFAEVGIIYAYLYETASANGRIQPWDSDEIAKATGVDAMVVDSLREPMEGYLVNKGFVYDWDEKASKPKAKKKYAWEGRVIKLNQRDYDRWVQSFSHIDVPAELATLDVYYASNGSDNWFYRTVNCLKKRNTEAMRQAEAERSGEDRGPKYRPANKPGEAADPVDLW